MSIYFQTNHKADCCGCGACSHVCPQKAITMTDDGQGFCYPVINRELCVHCGLCEKTCIFGEKIADTGADTKFYAVRSKDEAVVCRSSSGGMFTLMAEEIFSRGGVVYGVAYDENFRVEHAKAENMEQAAAFRGSKYVQSDNSSLYPSVKQDLEDGKTVLVTGTPCQIAGLKAFLERSPTDTEKLYTCDNICHGVSSPMVFADYMQSLKKYVPEGDRIRYVNMRHKPGTDGKTAFAVHTNGGKPLPQAEDYSFYRLYQTRTVTRPSCFACRFTSYSRVGDLSFGDFWNAKDGDIAFEAKTGLNEVLVNTPKGAELFAAVSERACFQEVSRELAWQPHLEYASPQPKNYGAFWEAYLHTDNREQVMRKYLKGSILPRVIKFAMPILRKTGLYTLFGKLYKAVFVKKA